MKLYFSPGSCSFAPHLAMLEAGLTFELVRVDLRKKTYAGGNYLDINPKGSVPVLETDNGERLTEAAVILQYIADSAPAKNLLPKPGSFERYRALEWLNYIATELHKGFGPLWKDYTPEDYKTIVKENLAKQFNYINGLLKNDFALGGQFSVVDAYLYTVLNWSNFLKIDLSPWPNITAYMERMRSRSLTAMAIEREKTNP